MKEFSASRAIAETRDWDAKIPVFEIGCIAPFSRTWSPRLSMPTITFSPFPDGTAHSIMRSRPFASASAFEAPFVTKGIRTPSVRSLAYRPWVVSTIVAKELALPTTDGCCPGRHETIGPLPLCQNQWSPMIWTFLIIGYGPLSSPCQSCSTLIRQRPNSSKTIRPNPPVIPM